MSDENAKDLAQRAGVQGRHATKNTARAVRAAAEPAVEEIREVGDKTADTAQDALHAVRRVGIGYHVPDIAAGALLLTMSLYTGALAYGKFRYVLSFQKGARAAQR